MSSSFSCTCSSFTYLLWRSSFSGLCPVFHYVNCYFCLFVIIELLLSCMSYFYILDIRSFSEANEGTLTEVWSGFREPTKMLKHPETSSGGKLWHPWAWRSKERKQCHRGPVGAGAVLLCEQSHCPESIKEAGEKHPDSLFSHPLISYQDSPFAESTRSPRAKISWSLRDTSAEQRRVENDERRKVTGGKAARAVARRYHTVLIIAALGGLPAAHGFPSSGISWPYLLV